MKFVRTIHVNESDDFRETLKYDDYSKSPETMLEQKSVPNQKANFAMQLLMHNGINSLVEDGESSSGAQKIRKETAKELVAKAVDVAESLFTEFELRGWLHKTIPYSEQNEMFMVARQIEISNGDKEH
jgi:hypothetical protein